VHGRRIAQNDCDGRRAWCVYSLVTLSVERVIHLSQSLEKWAKESFVQVGSSESRLTNTRESVLQASPDTALDPHRN